MQLDSNFVIVGAGPKALAVIAKSFVINKLFNIPMPKFHIIEKNEVGGNWTGSNGFTNGNLRLGTSPQKDIGFPYNSQFFKDERDELINQEMRQFSWDMYLIKNKKYAQWIDRGKPSPSHYEWAQYLKYCYSLFKDFVEIHCGELLEIVYTDSGVCVSYDDYGITKSIQSDYFMITGPGESRLKQPQNSERILDINSYWKKKVEIDEGERVLIIGGGENSATIALDIHQRFSGKGVSLNIMTPSGVLITRGESYFENRVYTNASYAHWDSLTREEKVSFVRHTDLGVYSVDAMNELSRTANLNILRGRVSASVEVDSKVLVSLENGECEQKSFDRVIWANGFQKIGLFTSTLNQESRKELEAILGEISDHNLESKIDKDLSLIGLNSKIYLPMISGMSQGPGFSNLSSLGTLADRVISDFVVSEKVEFKNVAN